MLSRVEHVEKVRSLPPFYDRLNSLRSKQRDAPSVYLR